jgi:TolA-binding protein
MTIAACPSDEQLSRALGGGADAALERHVAGCEACRATQESFRAAIERARELPVSLPDAARSAEVRAGLRAMAAAEPVAPRRGAAWLVGVAAVAAAAVLVFALATAGGGPVASPSHVVVRASAGARYELSPPPWETLRLWEGTVDLDVTPLGPRDRVRVQVGESEVEVRGTRFQVTAREDRLVAVEVTHGRVEVRAAGSAASVLGPGQTWREPAEAAPAAALEPPPAAPTDEASEERSRRRPRPRAAPLRSKAAVTRALRPTREEELYDDAWDSLRARRFEAAARGFAAVLAESPNGSLADEAAFWRATSLARGGDSESAVGAFREFVGKYRASPRRGEAATILGWLLVDARRPDEAAALFRGALGDADANVRRSARDGLDAISRR